jgi:hypothetical protein
VSIPGELRDAPSLNARTSVWQTTLLPFETSMCIAHMFDL